MKQLLTLLLLLCSLTISSQSKIITGPKNKQQQAAAKPKQQTAAKPKQQTAAKPKQQQAAPKQQAASKQKPAAKPKQPSVSAPSGYENGYGYVDLGLSVKWATTNVGASSPTDYGSYYAWGETRTKSDYRWSTYFDSVNGSGSTFFKYATNKKTQLDLSDDAAHVNWGGSWRMPTRAEQDELREKCSWTWTTQNGVKGYKVSSKRNSNSIFLPVAGYRTIDDLYNVGYYGFYWSSSLYSGNSNKTCLLSFSSDDLGWYYDFDRDHGMSVRAVCP